MEAWLGNGVRIRLKSQVDPLGPMTRDRAKRFKESLNVLIQDAQVEEAHVFNSKEETKMAHFIKENSELDQELRRLLLGP